MHMRQKFYWMAKERLVSLITGVAHQGRPCRRFPLQREVIVAGGSINSPQLLQLSGIGPQKLLADLGALTRSTI